MKKSIPAILAVLILFLLLSHPSLSLLGARKGLLLWSQTVLPTLLPFMLCSNLIVMLGGISLLTIPFSPILTALLHLSRPGGYVLIVGLLCGYPMGAKTCREFLEQGRISLPEASYLLAICNHPSPMFLLGYAAANLNPTIPISRLLLTLYLPILPIAWIARGCYQGLPNTSTYSCASSSSQTNNFDESMLSSFEVMIRIGGYIMIFSIAAVFAETLLPLSPKLLAVLLGLIEITTGIPMIHSAIPAPMQGLFLACVLAFGGLSGIFQTKGVLTPVSNTKNAGLSIRHYLLWKSLHTLLTGILAWALIVCPYAS